MQQLFIHLHDNDASWAVCDDADALPDQVERGALEHLACPEDDYRTIVFVPTTEVLLTSAQVPATGQRLAQAVPYALEEQVIDDIESMHVAVGKQDSDGKVSAALVNTATMQGWLDRLAAAGVEADVVLPDALGLEQLNGHWSALQLGGDIVCVRSGEQSGFACDRTNLAAYAARHAAVGNGPDSVRFTDCSENNSDASMLSDAFKAPVQLQECNGDALATLIHGYAPGKGINLMQGRFKRATRWLRGRKRWLPAAVMLGLWLVLQFGSNIYTLQQLQATEAEYRDKIEQQLGQDFPEIKRIVNPRVQVRQALEKLRSGASSSGPGYLDLLAQVSPALGGNKAVTIRAMSYKNGVIDIELLVPDLQALETLKDAMQKVQGIGIEVKSASARKDKLVGQVRVRSTQ